jgi:hypothetical protein
MRAIHVPDYSDDPYGTLKKVVPIIGLDPADAAKTAYGGSFLFHHQELWPEDFLDRAEADLESGGEGASLNAITNAKRAIHCQVDTVLAASGYDPTRLSMRTKLQKVAALGFVAPRILKRVSDTRNVLEHEYRRPDPDHVAEAVDLATLFVGMAGQALRSLGGSFSIGNLADYRQQATGMFSRCLDFNINTYKHSVTLRGTGIALPGYSGNSWEVDLATIQVGEPLYDASFRLAIARNRGRQLQLAVADFLLELESCPDR